MPTEQNLINLVVNKVDTLETYKAMKNAGKVNPDELYSIEELNDLTIDAVPSEDSPNLVTSGGVYQAIQNIPTPDVSGQIEAHNTDTAAHSDIRAAMPTILLKNW